MRKVVFAYAKTKAEIDFAKTTEPSLYFLNSKFLASSRLPLLYNPASVGRGRKPRRQVFSRRGYLLAHLSHRLIGELKYTDAPASIRPSVVVVRHSQCTNIFFSETKLCVEPLWVGGTKVCSQHLNHMTKMAAKPINGINPSKTFFFGTG